ncbi:MAG: universal stress protein [Solirubrobacteraceae bacterium]
MFRNVVVGVDGRQGGRDAIALAKLLAAPGATITLAHVYGQGGAIGRGAGLMLFEEHDRSAALLRAERARAQLDAGMALRCSPHPARGLHELAQERSADLLVVGSTRHGVLGRALIADHSRAALNGAPCAVAIAPRGYTAMDHRLQTIGVGYDGTPESEVALATSRELAGRYDAAITAMWVVTRQDVGDEAPMPEDWPEATEVLVYHRQKELERHGIAAEATYGDPKLELSHLGDRMDLIVVGSRGHGAARRPFHGTTSTYLTRHLGCPLLQLPRAANGVGDEGQTVASQEPAVQVG